MVLTVRSDSNQTVSDKPGPVQSSALSVGLVAHRGHSIIQSALSTDRPLGLSVKKPIGAAPELAEWWGQPTSPDLCGRRVYRPGHSLAPESTLDLVLSTRHAMCPRRAPDEEQTGPG